MYIYSYIVILCTKNVHPKTNSKGCLISAEVLRSCDLDPWRLCQAQVAELGWIQGHLVAVNQWLSGTDSGGSMVVEKCW